MAIINYCSEKYMWIKNFTINENSNYHNIHVYIYAAHFYLLLS